MRDTLLFTNFASLFAVYEAKLALVVLFQPKMLLASLFQEAM
jgi:hypothetical protein